jgi:hypothetical protein
MRKAALAALLLAALALSFGSPAREIGPLHQALSLAGLAGYVLLGLYPPAEPSLQRRFLVAGAVAGLAAFLLVILAVASPGRELARALAVAAVALPLWPSAGPARGLFGAAALLALLGLVPAWPDHPVAASLHAYAAAAAAGWVAARVDRGQASGGRRRRAPVQVLGAPSGIRLSPEERAERRRRVEERFRRGEIPEHVYWDQLQELESR